MLSKRYTSNTTKTGTFKTVLRPIILYGCETWALTRKMASILMTRERKILRKIYGPKQTDIVTEIKIRRPKWPGHVIRMEDTRIPEMIFSTEPEADVELEDPS
jgi:hypothetical protein